MEPSVRDLARGRWPLILSQLASVKSEHLSKRHGPCPVCGGRDRFRFDDLGGNGSFFCNKCGAGDGIKLLMLLKNWSFRQAASTVTSYLCGAPVDARATTKSEQSIAKVLDESVSITTSSPASAYLRKRIAKLLEIPECLKYHSNLEYFEDNQLISKSPAIIAPVSRIDGRIVTLHRTYISHAGEKAFGGKSKKLMPAVYAGACSGAAVKLFTPLDQLGLCEGIETALAAQIATGIPTWATVSASLMPSVEIPKTIKEVIIFADNDSNQTGQKAARVTAARLARQGFKVKIVIPPEPDTDWLDVWNEANQWKIT